MAAVRRRLSPDVRIFADSGVDAETRVTRLMARQQAIDSVNRDPRSSYREFDLLQAPPRRMSTRAGAGHVMDIACGDCAATTMLFGRSGRIAEISFRADAKPGVKARMCEMAAVARTFAWPSR